MTPRAAKGLGAVVRGLWAGIDAANAIRHGLPAPDTARVTVDAAQAECGAGGRVRRAWLDRAPASRGVIPFR
jgi:hypothetical protein